ncbi:4Fe-4S dicluster domain-containing protein [Ornithinimicrobium sp. F0845]|uniref:4Fe-4S dicluster domain-containing protein n=1 Tax=Ornithinimicrobium sp. F0845 TaxID=2926412 RepID=UPI001FF2E601|nr:4Fe-4S dicluster domain-containing protein [Ornithinimicrobium sp. F0845]MCK0111812.1 4Fe-4S dicluster domain-containing protein [Ornithinimicrobium sp. F0845]
MGYLARQLGGRTDPAPDAGWEEPPSRKGFFTDTSICIGCKACEVACKEWNALPLDGLELSGNSYDNTGGLGASTWRHVAFVEQSQDRIEAARESGRRLVDLGMPSVGAPSAAPGGSLPDRAGSPQEGAGGGQNLPKNGMPAGYGTLPAPPEDHGPSLGDLLTEKDAVENGAHGTTVDGTPMVGPLPEFRWLMASDVCKHCTHAGCLDVCPTGALFRSEHGTVVVQADICNGCGYCVGACPFGVIERRTDSAASVRADGHVPNVGVAQKCTLCYDRLQHDQRPACAQTCPTTSIRFGEREEMVAAARERVVQLHEQGFTEARLYGANEDDGVGGTGSVFLLLDEPEVYGLPPDPVCATSKLAEMFRMAGWAGTGLLAAAAAAFLGGRR